MTIPSLKVEPSGESTKGKSVLRKKHKPQREYIAVSSMQSETESDIDIPKAPKKGEFSRVIQKTPSGGEKKEPKENKARSNPIPVGKPKRGKKTKLDLDEAI